MKSLPTVQQVNLNNYMEVVKKLDPELFLIKAALLETGLNAMIIPQIIRTIGNLALGTGYGRVQIFMQAKVITNIKPEENVIVNERAVTDDA